MELIKIVCTLMLGVGMLAANALAGENEFPRKVAFSAEHEGGLHLLDYMSGKIRQLNVGLLNIGDLDYASSKNLLAFETAEGHEGPRSLYLFHLKNNKLEHIYKEIPGKSSLYRPKFDPKGDYLYALNYSDGIHRYSLSGRTWEKLRISGIESLNPQGLSFSKTGRKAAISPGNFKGFHIARVENGEFSVEEHVLRDFSSCTSPQWIEDEAIVFAGRKEAGLQFLWKLGISSGRLTQITGAPLGARDFLTLSKDEKTIVFTATGKQLEWRLWEVSVDGTGLRQLTQGGPLSSHLSPVWIE